MVTGGRRKEPRESGRATGSGKKKKEREQMKAGEGGRKEYSGNKKRFREGEGNRTRGWWGSNWERKEE